MNTNSPEVTKLLKFSMAAVGMLVLFLAFETISVIKTLGVPNQGYNSISVSGTGTATSTPDIATFSFSVTADAAQSTDAQSQINTKVAKIVADLKAQQIADNDIVTSDYSVNPKYEYQSVICPMNGICPPSKQIQDGYTANQSVTVKVRNLSNAGNDIAIAGNDGATDISGLNFTLDNPNAPTDLARSRAIADAKTHAQTLAQELGVKLGKVTGYDENASSGGPYPIYSMAKATGVDAAVAPIATLPSGENTVSSNVTVTYQIQ